MGKPTCACGKCKIELSEESKKEIEEIRNKIRGDMSDKEWKLFQSIRV